MFQGHRVTIIIPAYNEEQTIADVVREFSAEEAVDRVLVVDNNCSDRTADLAREAGADVVAEDKPGYGEALRRGMDEAVEEGTDLLVLTEADGSFRGADLGKLLQYVNDAQVVLGTRTTRQLVGQGANMNALLRWGNVTVAKFLELLWFFPHEPRLTDVGCTYRALWSSAWTTMRDSLHASGPAFSPEMICIAYGLRMRVIEIPVHYGARLGGDSKHSAGIRGPLRTGFAMIGTILRRRFLG